MRAYKVIVGSWVKPNLIHHTFKTLDEAIWEMCERLYVNNNLDLIDKGEFVTTFMLKKPHEKTYQLYVNIPSTIVTLKKQDTGDWNTVLVMDRIKHIKNLYKESKGERV